MCVITKNPNAISIIDVFKQSDVTIPNKLICVFW